MTKKIENKIIHVETKDKLEHYTFNFSMLQKLNEDHGTIYGGLNLRDEIVTIIHEQFKMALIKYAYNIDMDKDEDVLFYFKKLYPNDFKDMTLEEFKQNNISDLA